MQTIEKCKYSESTFEGDKIKGLSIGNLTLSRVKEILTTLENDTTCLGLPLLENAMFNVDLLVHLSDDIRLLCDTLKVDHTGEVYIEYDRELIWVGDNFKLKCLDTILCYCESIETSKY